MFNYINKTLALIIHICLISICDMLAIPKLMISMKKIGEDLVLHLSGMPMLPNSHAGKNLYTDKKEFFIYPTTEWKSIKLENTHPMIFG